MFQENLFPKTSRKIRRFGKRVEGCCCIEKREEKGRYVLQKSRYCARSLRNNPKEKAGNLFSTCLKYRGNFDVSDVLGKGLIQ